MFDAVEREGHKEATAVTANAGDLAAAASPVQSLLPVLTLSPHGPAPGPLSADPTERKTQIHTKTCEWMFTAALCVMAPQGTPPSCPSASEWCVGAAEYYAATKRDASPGLTVRERTHRKGYIVYNSMCTTFSEGWRRGTDSWCRSWGQGDHRQQPRRELCGGGSVLYLGCGDHTDLYTSDAFADHARTRTHIRTHAHARTLAGVPMGHTLAALTSCCGCVRCHHKRRTGPSVD